MWPSSTPITTSSSSSNTPYRPFESAFEDFTRPNPFPSPEPPVPPPTSLSLSPPPQTLEGVASTSGPNNNNNWALSPPAEVVTSVGGNKQGANVVVVSATDLIEVVS